METRTYVPSIKVDMVGKNVSPFLFVLLCTLLLLFCYNLIIALFGTETQFRHCLGAGGV